MKLHIRIKYIQYTTTLVGIDHSKTKCIIHWINPITGNIQRSVGVARRNPSDKPDIVKGQRIAESRAKINMWKTFNKSLEKTIKNVSSRNYIFIYHEEQHLHNLINDIKTN